MKDSFLSTLIPESYEIQLTVHGGDSYNNVQVEYHAVVQIDNPPEMCLEAVSMTIRDAVDPSTSITFKSDINGEDEKSQWTAMTLLLHKIQAAIAESFIQ